MELELGREAYARCDWLDAFEAFSAADRETRLGIDDLELAAIAASMAGRMDEYAALLERAHHACLESRETPRAARYAVMLGMNLAVRGELGPAGGWFGRAQRLIERVTEDCAERGWVLVPVAVQRQGAGDLEGAFDVATEVAAIGERFGDHGLFAVATHFQGLIRIRQTRVEEGLRLLDEAMVSVTGGDVQPFLTGVIYCGVIAGCEEAFEPRRAHEWTNALSRLAQGDADAAAGAIRRALGEEREPLKRAAFLPAYAEIMLAAGDVEEAGRGCAELGDIAATFDSAMLSARAAHVRGAVALAEGDAQGALASLRHAAQVWQELEAPYEGARVRVLIGQACRALGDDDTAELELDAARDAFEQLGAAPDLARLDTSQGDRHGLSARELEVLRLVAAGKTNREIASALVVSEHTVARHVQNI